MSIFYVTIPAISNINHTITNKYPRGPALPPKSSKGQNGPVTNAKIT